MTSIIARLYASPDQARSAVADLRRYAEFTSEPVTVTGPASAAGEAVAAALAGTGLSRGEAQRTVAAAGAGATLVTLRAPLGTAARAIRVLDRHDPLSVGAGPIYAEQDDPAPFSKALGLPVLTRTGAPVFGGLSRRQTSGTRLLTRAPRAKLMRSAAPLSRALGMTLLSRGAAPFSRLLNWHTLSAEQNPRIRLWDSTPRHARAEPTRSLVTRLYKSHAVAMETVAALQAAGFSTNDMRMIGRVAAAEAGAPAPTTAGMVAALVHAEVPLARATSAIAEAGPDSAILTLRARFGRAAAAARVMDAAGPVALGGPRTVWTRPDDPGPFSRFFGLALLAPPGGTPFSAFFGLKVLARHQNPSLRLSHNPAPFSRALNWRPLSARQTVSVRLSNEAAPLSRVLGWRTLSEDPKSYTELKTDPTPLSHALGLPVLARY